MSAVRLCVLGSGSGGNGSWLSLPTHDGSVECFIDAGLSPKATGERLKARGLLPIAPRALVLTHADGDHWRPTWASHVERLGMRVLARREHHASLLAAGVPHARLEALAAGTPTELAPGVTVEAHATPHDEHGSTALRFESRCSRVAWLTDLGRADPDVIEFSRGCDLLAIESNYCTQMQMASRRPLMLKQRIMGGKGHLSNEQCVDAVASIASQPSTRPHRVVLLHLSRDCNHPTRIRQLWRERAPHLADRLVLSSQTTPTPVLGIGAETAAGAAPFTAGTVTPFEASIPAVRQTGAHR